jgi:hypothetical protein
MSMICRSRRLRLLSFLMRVSVGLTGPRFLSAKKLAC